METYPKILLAKRAYRVGPAPCAPPIPGPDSKSAAAVVPAPPVVEEEEAFPALLKTNVFVAGGGPAGMGILVRLEREGILEKICAEKNGFADEVPLILVERSNIDGLGRGKLGRYLCPSNTSAACFVKNVSRDGIDGATPGKILAESETTGVAAALLRCGPDAADLTQVGQYLSTTSQNLVGARFGRLENRTEKRALLFVSTSIDGVELLKDGTFKISCTVTKSCARSSRKMTVIAKKLLCALGGTPYFPCNIQKSIDEHVQLINKRRKPVRGMPSCPKQKQKPPLVLSGDEVLCKEGVKAVFGRLGGKSESSNKDALGGPRVVIVGGSHTALATAYVLLKASGGDERMVNIIESDPVDSKAGAQDAGDNKKTNKLYSFKGGDIVIVHRSSLSLFFHSVDNAKRAGFTVSPGQISKKNRVNPHGGLRGPARNLAIKIKNGREGRAKFLLCKQEEGLLKHLEKLNPVVIVYATGYSANLNNVPFLLGGGSSAIELKTNRVKSVQISDNGELLRRVNADSYEPIQNCFSVGLGTAYPTDHPAVEGEKGNDRKSADGVNLYQNGFAKFLIPKLWPEYSRFRPTPPEVPENPKDESVAVKSSDAPEIGQSVPA
eukprot:g2303.t1